VPLWHVWGQLEPYLLLLILGGGRFHAVNDLKKDKLSSESYRMHGFSVLIQCDVPK
jgi:hypothetical protein